MRICYLILAHAQPPALWRLLDALEHPTSTAVVHVDARADLSQFRQVRDWVTWVETRSKCFHHGWGIAEATLRLIAAAPPADRYVLLSGDTFPLADQARVRSVIAAGGNAEWIDVIPFPAPYVRKDSTRLTRYHVRHDPRGSQIVRYSVLSMNRLAPRRDPTEALGGMRPWCGSQWWMLSGEALTYIRTELDRRPEFLRFCRHIGTPDEFLFQTLIGSSGTFAARVRPGAMYADFTVLPGPADIGPDHIANWKHRGFSGIDECGLHREYLFARKVKSAQIAAEIGASVWPLSRPSIPIG